MIAGLKSAVPVPAISANATVAPKLCTLAMPMKAAARSTSASTAQLRRDQRSATAPNSGDSSIGGT